MMIIKFLVAFGATVSFAVLFNAPPKHYLMCGLSGGMGWLVYSLMTSAGASVALASVFAALMLTIMARLASVALKAPVTIFLIAGIFPLVPGAGIYFTAYHLFSGNGAMASAKGVETLIVAGSISMGILFGSSLPQLFFNKLTGMVTGRKR